MDEQVQAWLASLWRHGNMDTYVDTTRLTRDVRALVEVLVAMRFSRLGTHAPIEGSIWAAVDAALAPFASMASSIIEEG